MRRTWRPASSAPARPRVSRAERFADGPRQALALSFAAAFVVCVAVEPEPTGPHADHLELWLLPVELLALTSIVAAVVLLMRGSSRAHPAGIAAGVLMCVGTALCPGLGHHVMGSFVWVQAGASLLVLLGSAALPRLGLPGRTPRT